MSVSGRTCAGLAAAVLAAALASGAWAQPDPGFKCGVSVGPCPPSTLASTADPFLPNAYDEYSFAGGGTLRSFSATRSATQDPERIVSARSVPLIHAKDVPGDDTAPPLDGDDEDDGGLDSSAAPPPAPPNPAAISWGTRMDPVQTSPQISPDGERLAGIVEPNSALGQLNLISVKLPQAAGLPRNESAASASAQLWDAQASLPWADLNEQDAREHNFIRLTSAAR